MTRKHHGWHGRHSEGHGHHRSHARYRPIAKRHHDDDDDALKHARVSNKHPEAIYVDHSAESGRTKLSSTLSFVKNDAHKQQDVYSTFREDQESHLIASIDFVGKKTEMVEIGNIFHEVDQTDVRTAGANASKPKVDDAAAYLESWVDQIIAAASKPGAPLPKITLVGHASYTAHEKIDRIKDAKGNIREIAHNPWLAEQRAENTRKYMEAIAKQKYPEFMKKHPHMFSPEHVKMEAKGDSELLVATKKEANPNRRTAIQMQSETVNNDDRLYRVYHVKADEAQALINHDVTRTYDLAKNTSLGKSLMSKDARVKVPAHGSLLLEDTNYQGRLNLKVLVAEADDFRVLIPKTAGEASYVMNRDGSFSVLVNRKEVAKIRVEMPDGQPIQAKDVLISSVNWKSGDGTGHDQEMVAKTTPVKRDYAREEKRDVAYKKFIQEEAIKNEKLAAQREQEKEAQEKAAIAAKEKAVRDAEAQKIAEQQRAALREKIVGDMDKDHDGVISKEERSSYQKIVNSMRPLGVDKRTELTVEDTQKKINNILNNEDYKKNEKEEKIASYKNMLNYIGTPQSGGMSVSAEQMAQAIKTRDEFDAMLREGKFQPPAGGVLTVAQVYDKAGVKSPLNTDGRPSASLGVPPRN